MKLRDKLIEETILVPMQTTSKESVNKELLTHLKSIDISSVNFLNAVCLENKFIKNIAIKVHSACKLHNELEFFQL